jgi:hypothetical protein
MEALINKLHYPHFDALAILISPLELATGNANKDRGYQIINVSLPEWLRGRT